MQYIKRKYQMYRQCPTHHVGKYAIILFDRCTLDQFSLKLSIAAGIGQDIDLNALFFSSFSEQNDAIITLQLNRHILSAVCQAILPVDVPSGPMACFGYLRLLVVLGRLLGLHPLMYCRNGS